MKIKIREIILGTHRWADCPHEEVDFLRNEHLHEFYVFVECNVDHSDREIEFIKLRIWLREFLDRYYQKKDTIFRFGTMSCEQISEEITRNLIQEFGHKNWKVSISEDNVYFGGEW